MKPSFGKKAAVALLILLTLALCVFFACACGQGSVTLDFSLKGDLLPGELLSVDLELKGEDALVKEYDQADCVLEVAEGTVASVEDGKVRLSSAAKGGETFTLRLTVKDLSVQKTFTVLVPTPDPAPNKPEKVELVAPASAEAGQVIPLSVKVTPSDYVGAVTYALISGEATLAGDVLTISESADGGEVLVKATVDGVDSETKTISITTVQTKELYLTLSSDRAMPGASVLYVVTKDPQNATYPVLLTLEKGADSAEIDVDKGTVTVKESTELGTEIELLARSGSKEARASFTVGRPAVTSVQAVGGGTVAPGKERNFAYKVLPEDADASQVTISVPEGLSSIEWAGGISFRVNADAAEGQEIIFLIEASDEVFTTVTFCVGKPVLTSLSIETTGSTSYLRSGESLTFTHVAEPQVPSVNVTYYATAGAEFVNVNGNVVTVKEGVGIGTVRIAAESEDGIQSNEVEFTVSGRYLRRAYSAWANVTLASSESTGCVWMVLPPALDAGGLTVLVPRDVVDLVIEGRYNGSEDTAYKNLYFYFRNAPERDVTLRNFGAVATQGLGGTVFDLGSSGKTTLILEGENLILADSPYMIDNSGEKVDGIWDNGYGEASREQVRRNGKSGYIGTAGGTAISGYDLVFMGSGTLRAVAGSGVNGTAGGSGADARYDGSPAYLSGTGGDGGHGGDSGVAIYAHEVSFSSGYVTAVPGNAGKGGKGGAAGSVTALAGYDLTVIAGDAGRDGKNGVAYPAVRATTISGSRYSSAVGAVVSLSETYTGGLPTFVEKLSRFYGVGLYYGSSLYNPYAKLSKSKRFVMEQQSDPTALMQQMNFLMYTMSRMPKNCWREIDYRSGKQITIYLCKSIKSGTGTVVLGLTSDANRVWFATFDTEVRGVYYGGYFNIMLHEFTHAFHYNFGSTARSGFETELKALNYGLDYKTSYGASERVYGVTDKYDETNSCFLSAYSRKSVMEDTAETMSIPATFLYLEPCLTKDANIRKKFDLLVKRFAQEYETLSTFKTSKTLFGNPYLYEEE